MADGVSSAPTLETGRLILRAHRLADYEPSAAMWGDEGVARFIGGKPFTPEEVWQRMLRYPGHWSLLGYGYWVLEEKATGDFVGEAGFLNLNRAIDPPFGDAPEAGWVLAPAAHGKGYATEAMERAAAWIDAGFGAARTVCMISPQNTPSLRVAEKLGYRQYASTTYKGSPTLLFERQGQ
jgi:RimJ/RimL family protein N-acetyltransferase